MCAEGQQLQAAVAQKLTEAANDIFALFQRAFAEYQDRLVRSKLFQQPLVVLCKEDIPTVSVEAESDPEPIQIKREEDSRLKVKITSPSVEPEQSVPESAATEGEEPGCSQDLDNNKQNISCTTSTRDKRSAQYDGQKLNSGAKSGVKKDRPQRYFLKKLLSCSDCGLTFTLRHSLKRHIHSTHYKEKHHTCSVCHMEFYRKYDYVRHLRKHTGERPFMCLVCEKSYTTKKALRKHKCYTRIQLPDSRLDRGETSELSDVQTVIVGENSAPEPMRSQKEDSVQSEDPGLDLDLDKNKEQNSSSDTENSSDWESMDQVSTKSDGQELKAGHSETTDNGAPHQCSQCFKTFESEKTFKKHVKHHEGQGSFSCQICNKVYNHKTSYARHLRVHSSKNPIRCTFCWQAFPSASSLSAHKRIHTGEKPYSCSSCGQMFRHRATRDRHFNTFHIAQRPYSCEICQKGFVQRYYYEIHMRIHTGEQPFRCSVCDRGFRERKNLKNHMRTHQR